MVCLIVTACSSTPAHRAKAPPSPASTRTVAIQPASQSSSNGSTTNATDAVPLTRRPRVPEHVVVVVEENHPLPSIIGRPDARYFTSLARSGASLTGMYAITHPSEPNYLALFAGTTEGLSSDSCPHTYRGTNLGDQLRRAKRSFVGYAEGLPHQGYAGCTAGSYARKHVPWTDFADLPSNVNQPLTSFPRDFAHLPSLSFVIPDLDHDMHDGTIAQADHWLHAHLDAYRRWAMTHHSVLVVTWDEDDHSDKNRIPTIIAGQDVRVGTYREHADHYRLLRTLEWLYRLPGVGHSAHRAPISDIWAG